MRKSDLIYNEHQITVKELCKRYNTTINFGLSSATAKVRLETTGLNILKPIKKHNEIVRFIKTLFYGFSALLWLGALLCLFIFVYDFKRGIESKDNLYVPLALIAIIIITGGFTFYQEGKSSKIMESFIAMVPDESTVMRDGTSNLIPAKNLVMGDLVMLTAGDKVPADIRITESNGLKIDNSIITGESEPKRRGILCTDLDPMLTENLAFFGTLTVEGTGKGIVIRTGEDTLMGHLAALTSSIKSVKTLMLTEIEHFVKIIIIWSTMLAVILGSMLVIAEYPWENTVIILVGLVIANVPEGLVATLTLCLTLAAKRMAQSNCLVKKMDVIESLGAASIICTDKTGTLTQNRMTVSRLWYDNRIVNTYLKGIGISRLERGSNSFKLLARCAILCNRAEFATRSTNEPVMERKVIGDPSESAILRCMEYILRGGVNTSRRQNPKMSEIPFNHVNKYQVSVHFTVSQNYLLVMKGAPETVLEKCSTVMFEKGEAELTKELMQSLIEAYADLAAMGERVLAFADMDSYIFNKENELKCPQSGLRFVGFISLTDPPRPNVPEAVLQCRRAGVKVMMVTGDHHLTAYGIAKQVNIISENSIVQMGLENHDENKISNAIVLQGSNLKQLKMEELDDIIKNYDEIVIARASPQEKLLVVESCQRIGAIVGVTGDGVNDAPAIKKANVGISMGISGSGVSKEAADIILLDDNFGTIVSGIEQGRLVYDNLKKSIAYTITHILPEITPIVANVILGIPLPMGMILILCIDLVTDMWPAISFAYEAPEGDLMLRKPRNMKLDHLISMPMLVLTCQIGAIEAASLMFSYFVVMAECGWWPKRLIHIAPFWENPSNSTVSDSFNRIWPFEDRLILQYTGCTAAFVSIVLTQLANAFICKTSRSSSCSRGLDNWNLNIAMLFSMVFVFLLTYIPMIARALHLQPLRARWWLPPLPFIFAIILYDEWRKLLMKHNPKNWLVKHTLY